MERTHELIVITKTYDLILWSCHHTSCFPRNHRFVLGERIERNLYDLLETLLGAKYTRLRQPLLEQANLTLEVLRFQVRLAKDLQCLKVNSYGFVAEASAFQSAGHCRHGSRIIRSRSYRPCAGAALPNRPCARPSWPRPT
jgi:hypothetical protein